MKLIHFVEYIIQHSKPSIIHRYSKQVYLFIITKLFVAVLISLCLSFSNATVPIANETNPCLCNLNVPVLNQFINTQIAAVLADQPSK